MDFDLSAIEQPQEAPAAYVVEAGAPPQLVTDIEELAGLQSLLEQVRPLRGAEKALEEGMEALRSEAIRDEALSFGTQGGLAWRTQRINEAILEPNAAQLSIVFNFTPLMIDGMALPPVIRRSDDNFELSSGASATRSTVIFSMENEARLVTRPPGWEDFLLQHYAAPQVPDRALLPRTPGESALWQRYVTEGWYEGVAQADDIFQVNLNTLLRVHTGMVNYHVLVDRGIVEPLSVARGELGVQRNGRTLSVGDTVYRLNQTPQWLDEGDWRPLIGEPRE